MSIRPVTCMNGIDRYSLNVTKVPIPILGYSFTYAVHSLSRSQPGGRVGIGQVGSGDHCAQSGL